MIARTLAPRVKKVAEKLPVVGIIGPRQSGKTTLVKAVFPEYTYVSLEELDNRAFAQEDPRGFLETYPKKTIIDEIQRVPELFSYLQTQIDDRKTPGQYILTGSQHFLMMESISQTLSGRISLHTLYPFTLDELMDADIAFKDYPEYLFQGTYPRIYDLKLDPTDWYPQYIQTYVERDVRRLRNVTDLATFQTFIKLCAGRIGQLLNLSSLGVEAGVTHNTVKSWLSLLEQSFIITLLRPHRKNFNKRLVKSPKLYFVDTGLAASLLGISDKNQLENHYLRGNLFENMVVMEFVKYVSHRGLQMNSFFWRDRTGHEIDVLIEKDEDLIPLEIKSGKTVTSDYFDNLSYWEKLSENVGLMYLLYGGKEGQKRGDVSVWGWRSMLELFRTLST